MNELEKALKAGEEPVNWYLESVSTQQFIADVKQYAASMADKGAVAKARDMLNEFLEEGK